ncbi:MAG: aldo/keto reductase [Bryobacteraceae bacterium]|jgi:aryl-alcohol dehydrogenase-like predicted oxidoreductase
MALKAELNRRAFLAASAATVASAALPARAMDAPATGDEWRNRQPNMTYRRLGRTGYMISSIGMGGDDIRPDNIDQVLWSADMGLNYFDTAPNYGNGLSEKGYAQVHKTRGRTNFFQSTKVNVFPNRTMTYQRLFKSLPDDEQAQITAQANDEIKAKKIAEPNYMGPYFNGQEMLVRMAIVSNILSQKYAGKVDAQKVYKQYILDSVDKSLQSLGTDHVDCVLMRGIDTPYEVTRTTEVFDAFEILKKAGKARFLGFSAHSDPAGILDAAIDTGVYSMGMIAYHFLNADRVDPVIEKARKADFGVLCMKAARVVQNPFNRRETIPERVAALNKLIPGDSMTVFQKGFHFALQNKNLSGVVIGMTTLEQAKQNIPLALSKS